MKHCAALLLAGLALVLTGIPVLLFYAPPPWLNSLKGTPTPSDYEVSSLLNGLQSNSTRTHKSNTAGAEVNIKDVNVNTSTIHWARGRLDSRRMVRIYEWVWTGSHWNDLMTKVDVCLATHSSLNRMVSIGEVSEKWLGPISLAVYIRIPEEWIALNLFVMYMQRCSAAFSQTVSVHVAVPADYKPSRNDSSRLANFPLWSRHPCGQPMEFLGIVMKDTVTKRMDPTLPYPQNHMRNVARKTCGTPWVFLTDVDIIPRPNSAQMLQQFYESPGSNCSKCQFVVPTFELSRTVKYPKSKQELAEYVNQGLARQFHLKTWIYSQLSTNYSLWSETNVEEGPIKVSHNVDIIQKNYEPFYIGPDWIAEHDERFVGYGYTRSSQVLEALEMGWKFKVLTPIFAIHWGFKWQQTNLETAQVAGRKQWSPDADPRTIQVSKNRAIWNAFKAELKARKNNSLAFGKET